MATISTNEATVTANDSSLPLRLIDGTADDVPTFMKPYEQDQSDFYADKVAHISTIRAIDKIDEHASEGDISSIDSLSLTDSPTISSASYRSSRSSLSGILFKSPASHSSDNSSSYRTHSRKHSGFSVPDAGTHLSDGKWVRSEYSTLRSQYAKFSGKHNAGKANYLRLTLIPFLRRRRPTLLPSSVELELPIKVFSKWWHKLLEVAEGNFKHVNGGDRDLFYEAISSLMTRPEWFDNELKPIYRNLLMRTTVHSLIKTSYTGSLTVAQAAFAGKVLAYAYMYLPDFAVYLLQLMATNDRAVHRLLAGETLDRSPFPEFSVPEHLRPLIRLSDRRKLQSAQKFIAWLPYQQCAGWERGFRVDSPMFASFFKHYCALITQYLPVDNQVGDLSPSETGSTMSHNAAKDAIENSEILLLSCPGMIIILTCIASRFDGIVMDSYRSLGSRNPYSLRQGPVSGAHGKGAGSSSGPQERVRIDQLKIFGAFREILHCEEATVPYFPAYSRLFDRVLKSVAINTRVHDMDGCVTVCDLAEEWFYSVFAVRASKSKYFVLTYKPIVVDWHFWLNVVQRMLKSDNCHTEVRGLSILFNIWPYIPNAASCCIISEVNPSILQEITKWILSPEIWMQLFFHWSPLVRSYYHRLLCYRLASVGVETSSWFIDVDSAQDLVESRELLKEMLVHTYKWCAFLSMKTRLSPECGPSLPMPHLRVGIARFGPLPSFQNTLMEKSVTRVFPFDIFDTAAYWQSDEANQNEEYSYDDNDIPLLVNRTQLERSASKASRVSNDSVMSTQSNASTVSNISVRSFSTVKKRFSMILGAKTQKQETSDVDEDEISEHGPKVNDHNEGDAESNKENAEKPAPASNMGKRWSLLQRALPSIKSSVKLDSKKAAAGTTLPVTASETESKKLTHSPALAPQPALERKRKPSNASASILQRPSQLTQPRPEIIRPPHRFVLVPTSAKHSGRSQLKVPRLPFAPEISPDQEPSNLDDRDAQKDLAAWNYGGRSLAEWNIEVLGFENFARQQRDVANESLEMFTMPFLVAEIPWRVSA